MLQQADAAIKREDWAAAAELLERYVAADPADYRAKFNLALACSMIGRQGDAIRLYRELADAHDLVPARVNLGMLLLQAGSTAEALAQFEQVVAKQPDHWAAQVNRAAALTVLNRIAEAKQAYERALALDPDHALTHLAYAKLLAPNEPANAEQHLRRALELDGSVEEARLLLADALVASASPEDTVRLDEAAAIYREALQRQSPDIDANKLRLRLADIYLSQHRLPEAIRELEGARAAGEPSFELNHTLLEAYVEAKQLDKALALIPEVLRQNEQSEDVYLLLGSIRMERRQYREAASAFLRVTEIEPQRAEGYTNLASALYLLRDYQGTLAALGKVAELGLDTAGTYFLRAITMDKLDLKQPALDNYRQFLASDEQKNPDQEFQARQRVEILQRELRR